MINKPLLSSIVILLVVCGFSNIYGQTQGDVLKQLQPAKNQKTVSPKITKYVFVLAIDIESNVSFSVQDAENSDRIGNLASPDALFELIEILNDPSIKNSKRIKYDFTIIVRADPALNYGLVIDFLRKIRKVGGDNIRVEISKNLPDPFAMIPEEPEENSESSFSPNTLIIEVTRERKVSINKMDSGTLYNISSLKEILSNIFRRREENLVLREGTNEVEKTVYIEADQSMHFGDVIQLFSAINEVGGSPIVLQIDGKTFPALKLPPRRKSQSN